MKRLRVLSLLPALLLASCSKVDYSGTYEFRLGKTDGSHLEVSAVLTNDAYTVEGTKKMTLSADLGAEMTPTAIIEQYGEEYPFLEPFIDIITDEVAGIKEIPLYYAVTQYKDAKRGVRLNVGTDFAVQKVEELKQKYPIIKELLEYLEIDDSKFEVTPEKAKYYFGAYVDNKVLTFEIPVSMDDLEMQEFWYGKSNRVSGDYVSRLPGTQGEERFGTHPKVVTNVQGQVTSSEVEETNKLFEKEFSNTPIYDVDNKKIGVLAEEEVNGRKDLKCYFQEEPASYPAPLDGFVYTKDIVGEYEHKQAIKLIVTDANGSSNAAPNGKEGRDEGFFDANFSEFRFSDTIRDPYVFRDFHTVNVGLSKI